MKIPSFSRLLSFLCLLALGPSLPATEPLRPDMTGVVKGPQGEPVSNALVILIAAGPRQGNSPLCPYSYPDCGKRASTDAGGNFRLESLDPAFDFAIRVLAPGYAPFVQSCILPETGPVPVNLQGRDVSQAPANSHVWGRILGPDGNPVAGAILDLDGVERGNSTRWGGTPQAWTEWQLAMATASSTFWGANLSTQSTLSSKRRDWPNAGRGWSTASYEEQKKRDEMPLRGAE